MAEISAELTLKVAGLQQGLEKARGELAAFKKYARSSGQGVGSEFGSGFRRGIGDLAGVFGVSLGVGAAVAGLRSISEYYDQISDSADALNSSVEGVQRLGYMAASTNTPMETLVSALLRIRRALNEVENESKRRALANIGLDAEKFIGLDADRQFIQLARSFEEAQNSGRGFAEIMALVRGASPDLISALSAGGDALERFSDRAVASAAQIETFTANLGRMKAFGMETANSLGPLVEKFANFTSVVGGMAGGMLSGMGFLESAGAVADLKKQEAAGARETEAIKKRLRDARAAEEKRIIDERLAKEKAAEAEKDAAQKTRQAKEAADNARSRGEMMEELRIKEARAAGRTGAADKMQRELDFERNKQKYIKQGFDEKGATEMARREQIASDRMANPGRIRGYAKPAESPHAGLDWLYGHNRDKGGQPMNKEFKFPGLDEMNRTLGRIEKLIE